MSLYDNLEVPINASPETIKKAFRRKAQKHHPDKGGDKAAMQAVQTAYDVLGDPERRARYDETGTTEQAPALEAQARQALYGLLNNAIDRLDVDFDNPLEAARDELHTAMASNVEARVATEAKIAAREKALKRLEHLEGSRAVVEALEMAIVTLQAELEKAEKSQALCRLVLDLLAEYDYAVDERPAGKMPAVDLQAIQKLIFANAFRRP